MRSTGSGPRPPLTVVFDCDGVLYLGDEAVPGAARTLGSLDRLGVELLFCTNNSARTPGHLADKIARLLGYRPPEAAVITSALAAARVVRQAGFDTAALLGMEGVVAALGEEGISVGGEEAPAVVVGIDFALDYPSIRRAAEVVRRGGLFVATNTDPTYPVPGGLWPGAGMVVAAVATAGGRAPDVVAGKPHLPMVTLIKDRCSSDDVVVVGDRPDTDLALARAGGWRSVAVLTGVTTHRRDIPDDLAPDDVIASVEDLVDILGL